MCELGAALRRGNHRRDAREPLREAVALAQQCGAHGLAQRARDELLAAGGRPRRDALRGIDALTASELRVAQLAALGHANREIASELVVTVRTVEFHLSRAYSKLGIASRSELARALNGGAQAPP
jgi:DNA-binding NarL/FixJ family response regulator